MNNSNGKLRRSASYPLVYTTSTDSGKNSSDMHQATSMRQPGTTTRPFSLRDVNEQISALRRENFNLKLDLFLLRERFGVNGTKNDDGNDLWNCKLEIDRLREELRVKTAIITEALAGIRYMENVEDQIERKYAVKIQMLQQKIQLLEDSNTERLKKISKLSNEVE